jgi:selenocysteine lyase/cysteine desulfurase
MKQGKMTKNLDGLLSKIRNAVIGEKQLFKTAYGQRPIIYADYTASGRSLKFIEDYIQSHILPFYANTHSETSATGRQSGAFREQARSLIAKSIGANDDHAVIFAGAGATAAINKLISILNIRLPSALEDKYDFLSQIAEEDRPVIFVGPYEHHSNELPWRESIADVVKIPFADCGMIDVAALEEALQKYRSRKLKIGSFSAASNVTGLLSNVGEITEILHKYDALSMWDYAAAGPYVNIDMAGLDLDAIYISPHKFIGGPGTPGILALKRTLLTNKVPSMPGGGTVSWVTPSGHTYLPAGVRREEGGTPAIVESIRAGMVFQLKDAVGSDNIEQLEHKMVTGAIKRWSQMDNIHILGCKEAARTSIVSFQIMAPNGKPLHYGLVVALLNDLFGIQVRGGCSCAGPYGHDLLNITPEFSTQIEDVVALGNSIIKLGWVRLNFNYFIGDETYEYLLSAVELIAKHGLKLHEAYEYDDARGVWSHRNGVKASLYDLGNISFGDDFYSRDAKNIRCEENLTSYTEKAIQIIGEAYKTPSCFCIKLSKEAQKLRWFALPCDF